MPHGHGKTPTFIAALRHDRVDAPRVIDGPINSEVFATRVDQLPVATLAPGDIVILDTLGSPEGRRAIRDAGAHLPFLPPHSPDLDPIEQLFAEPEPPMREAAPRTVEDTRRQARTLLDILGPTACTNSLANSGYAST